MHTAIKFLVLLAVLSGQLAQAGDQQSSATTTFAEPRDGDVLGEPGNEPANARTSSPRRTVFKLHPLPMVGGMIVSLATSSTIILVPLEMEFAVGPNLSLYGLVTPTFSPARSGSAFGLGLNGGLRLYLSGNAPAGFWLGGQLGAGLFAPGVSFDVQPQIGYQWVLENGYTIGVGGGLSLGALANRQSPLTFVLPVGFTW